MLLWAVDISAIGVVIRSSPAVADIDDDGQNEIIIGTDTGYVVSLTRTVEWAFNDAGNIGEVSSSVALADTDWDGFLEIIVTDNANQCVHVIGD